MTIKDLKAIIADLPDAMEVLTWIDGEASRTGDWFKIDSVYTGFAVATTYGGYDGDKNREKVVQNAFTQGEVFEAVFIS